MTSDSKERFLGEQLRALATIVLTRRDDLFPPRETKQGTGIDLHVEIDREDQPMRLTFGVMLRGVPSPVTIEQANHVLGPTMGQFRSMKKFTYPVCLFFFTLKEEQRFFSWLAEPVLEGDSPKLVHRQEADCVVLTDDVLHEVVERVVSWYDAMAGRVVV